MALGMRQVRAIVLVTAALVAVTAVSFGYLRPGTAPPAIARPAAPVVVQGEVRWTQSDIVETINLIGPTGGDHVTWHRAPGGSGGHAR